MECSRWSNCPIFDNGIVDGILCGPYQPFPWVYYSPLEEGEGNRSRIGREMHAKAIGYIVMRLKVSLIQKGIKMVCLQSAVSCPFIAQIKFNVAKLPVTEFLEDN
jgi:hypothetical protein